MAGIPEVFIFCLAALVVVMVLYLCMRRTRAPPGRRRRETLVTQKYLPGESRDQGNPQQQQQQRDEIPQRRPVSYLFLNCGHVTDDTPPPKEASGSWAAGLDPAELRVRWQEYNRLQWLVPLSKRGEQQSQLARREPSREAGLSEGVLYSYLRDRCVHCFAANNLRAIQTAEHLMKVNCVGKKYSPEDQLSTRVSRIGVLDSLSPYGTSKANFSVSMGVQEIQAALSREGAHGFWEESLDGLYWPGGSDAQARIDPVSHRATKDRMNDFVLRVVTELRGKLNDDEHSTSYMPNPKVAMDSSGEKRPKDHIVLVVGQTPYINAVAAHVAGLFGHTSQWIRKRILERDDVGYMDGFVVGVAPHLCNGHNGATPVFPEHLCTPPGNDPRAFPFINYDDHAPDDERGVVGSQPASPDGSRSKSPAGRGRGARAASVHSGSRSSAVPHRPPPQPLQSGGVAV